MRKESNYIYGKTVPNLTAHITKLCDSSNQTEEYILGVIDKLKVSKSVPLILKAMISLLFSSGIRVSELLRIKGTDIDSLLNIHVIGSKKSNNRVVSVVYFQNEWLGFRGSLYSLGSIYSRFYIYREMKKLGINKTFGNNKKESVTHAPRHYHLLQLRSKGIDKETLSAHIGHKSRKSLESYVNG